MIPYDGKSRGSEPGASESIGLLLVVGLRRDFTGEELGKAIGDELPPYCSSLAADKCSFSVGLTLE
jgi:hypothetical protein